MRRSRVCFWVCLKPSSNLLGQRRLSIQILNTSALMSPKCWVVARTNLEMLRPGQTKRNNLPRMIFKYLDFPYFLCSLNYFLRFKLSNMNRIFTGCENKSPSGAIKTRSEDLRNFCFKAFSTLPVLKLWWGNSVFKYKYLPVKYYHHLLAALITFE